jgi:hypothetical protein
LINTQQPCDCPLGHAVVAQTLDLRTLETVELGPATKVATIGLGASNPRKAPLADHFALNRNLL